MKMKFTITILLFFLTSSISLAQNSRNNNKKNVVYRTSYQRAESGPSSSSSFEIREGQLWAAGYNLNGQLGNGTTTDVASPVQIGNQENWLFVSSGSNHTAAVKSDGTLWTWGANNAGQLGTGNNTNSTVPIQIGTDTKWISASAGSQFTIALKSDGTLWSWGFNTVGQLGDGTLTNRNFPQQIGTSSNWVSISVGNSHTLALTANGQLYSWGANNNGQLGVGNSTDSNSPLLIGTDNNWSTIATGLNHSFAIKTNGTLWGWGRNLVGQLGDGTSADHNVPFQIGTATNWVEVSGGTMHSLALKTDGTLWGTGQNGNGQLGTGNLIGFTAFTQIGTDNNWVDIESGSYHSLAVKATGDLLAWGANQKGQLAIGNFVQSTTPVIVRKSNSEWISIVSGEIHTLAIRSNGTLWGWGDNSTYALGLGNTINQNGPIQIGTDSTWIGIAAGNNFSFGIKANGTLWSWGTGSSGQLGNGSNSLKSTPFQVGTETNWVSIACAGTNSIALKGDGTLWTWGSNGNGQLGVGSSPILSNVPLQVGIDNDWISVSNGVQHSLAIKSNGTLWAWGTNSDGKFGNGTTVSSNIPVQVGTENTWVYMVGSLQNTFGLKANGTIWGTGWNSLGQVGDGTNTNRISFVQLGSDNSWTAISSRYQTAHALKTNGTLWGWGINSDGQIGSGNTSNSNTIIQIGSSSNWIAVTDGSAHSTGLKSRRLEYCSTGLNDGGQLGNYTTTNTTSMNCISCIVPSQPLAILGELSLCAGTNQIYSVAPGAGATTYSWTIPNGWIGSSSTNQIPVTIGTVSGQISVVANSSCGNSQATTINTTVNSIPVISSGIVGNSAVCSTTDEIYTLDPVAGATTYQWNFPGDWAGNSTTNSITLICGSSSGNIEVTASNTCGTSSIVSYTVVTSSIPASPSVLNGNAVTCSGSNNPYSVDPVSNATSYTWSLPNTWTGSSSSENIVATASENGGVISVTADNNCGSSLPIDVTVIVDVVPTVTGNNLTICAGEIAELEVASDYGTTSWYDELTAGNELSTGLTFTSMPLYSDTVFYVESNNNGCVNNPRFTINVTVNPMPIIDLNPGGGSIVALQNNAQYQWLDCNDNYSILNGQTDQSFELIENGSYAVEINLGGCIDTSACEIVSNVSLMEQFASTILLYPNPTKAEFTIESSNGIAYLEILSLAGQIVEEKTFEGQEKVNLELVAAPGIYLVKIKEMNGSAMHVIRLTKE